MTDGPIAMDALGELPTLARGAAEGVLELYEAIRQAKALGASYSQLCEATGLPRGTVQNIVSGRLPKFAVE